METEKLIDLMSKEDKEQVLKYIKKIEAFESEIFWDKIELFFEIILRRKDRLLTKLRIEVFKIELASYQVRILDIISKYEVF